jgi:hypothetical protein
MFENIPTVDSGTDLLNYLSMYSTKPFTKAELLDKMMLKAMEDVDVTKLFRVKSNGRDRDPMFWSFGKIHGLENIAFADPNEIKETKGNPVKIQSIINRVDAPNIQIDSYEHLVQELHTALDAYKVKVDSIGMNPSDRKKILALPFYLTKRHELPEPKRG